MTTNIPTIPSATSSGTAPTTAVLLEHTLPDSSLHFDWLIERPHGPTGVAPEHRMITFRCTIDPLDPEAEWIGQRLPDHRAHYIEYEGLVSGGRGAVRRLWRTPCWLIAEHPDFVRLSIEHPRDHTRLCVTATRRPPTGPCHEPDSWTIVCSRADLSHP